MSDEKIIVVIARSVRAIPNGGYCGFTFQGSKIRFYAPVAILVGDRLIIDVRDGRPYAIFRPGRGLIWRYQSEVDPARLAFRGEISGEIAQEAIQKIWEAFGRTR